MKRTILCLALSSAIATAVAFADPDTDQVTGRSITFTDHNGNSVTEYHAIQQKPTVTVIPDYVWEERFTTTDIDGGKTHHVRLHKVYHLKGEGASKEVVEEGTIRE